MNKKFTVGCILYGSQQNWHQELQLVAGDSANVVAIDLTKPIESQGNFDIIIHKVVKLLAKELMSNKRTKELIMLEQYLKKHPKVSFDPLDTIRTLCNRKKIFSTLEDIKVEQPFGNVYVPKTISIENEEELNEILSKGFPLKFPVVCKPFVADGNHLSHQCALAHNLKGVKQMKLPAVFQEFHDHDGVLYKAYILGEEIHQKTRPSLPNYNHKLNRPTPLEYFGRISNARENGSKTVNPKFVHFPEERLLHSLKEQVRERLSLNLFGIDLIRESTTGDFYLIDINYLPGYYGVYNLQAKLLNIFRETYLKRHRNNNQKTSNKNDHSNKLNNTNNNKNNNSIELTSKMSLMNVNKKTKHFAQSNNLLLDTN